MDIEKFMRKHHLTDDLLDEMAAPFEEGNYKLSDGAIYSGSHLDAVGSKRVTVVYPAKQAQKASALARARGVKPSEIYRAALDAYLAQPKMA